MADSTLYRFGRLAGAKFLKAKWVWESVAGDETEAIRAEHGVGRTMAEAVRRETACDTDTRTVAWLRGIQTRLVDRVNNRAHRFAVAVTDESTPNAFALPGGFIFVAGGLVELCERQEDELGFIVAHEMAHVIRRHAIDRVLGHTALSAAALASPARGVVGAWVRKVGLEWLERAYSREQEFEADELGGLLMRAAGFDPGGAVRALQRFAERQDAAGELGPGAYLSTHPPVTDRIARLGERLRI